MPTPEACNLGCSLLAICSNIFKVSDTNPQSKVYESKDKDGKDLESHEAEASLTAEDRADKDQWRVKGDNISTKMKQGSSRRELQKTVALGKTHETSKYFDETDFFWSGLLRILLKNFCLTKQLTLFTHAKRMNTEVQL